MTMVERVAHALCRVRGVKPEELLSIHLDMARAAIDAMREPTEAMFDATLGMVDTGDRGTTADREDIVGNVWRVMIHAALTEKS